MGIVTQGSAEYRLLGGRIQRSRKSVLVRGLNRNHNHDLKALFKGAAVTAIRRVPQWEQFYRDKLSQGRKPELALLTVARKIATIAWTLWKKGDRFDAQHLKAQAA